MKRIAFIFLGLLIFTSCTGTYIFRAVESEIKLKKATTKGTVRNVVVVGDDLYVDSGTIRTKKAFDDGEWTTVAPPKEKLFCASLATDGATLFATFIDDYSSDESVVYYYDGGAWQTVPNSTGIQHVIGNGTIFGTKTTTTLDSGGTEVESETLEIFTLTTGGAATTPIRTETVEGDNAPHISAACGNYFASPAGVFDASGSSAGSQKDIVAIVEGGGKTYFITSTEIFTSLNSSTSYAHKINAPSAATFVSIAGIDRLLVTSGERGYFEIILNDDIAKWETKSPASFDESSTPPECINQYDASIRQYCCGAVCAKSEPTAEGGERYFVYIGLNDPHFANYTGLWGLYKNTSAADKKSEWNRE